MNKMTKLILALQQVENVYKLLSDSQYVGFFSSHLLPVKFEIQRQIHCLTNTEYQSKIEE